MSTEKIAITINDSVLKRIDSLVREKAFPSRSRIIQEALKEKLERMDRRRLARECAKLEVKYERELAEEGMEEDLREWPEY